MCTAWPGPQKTAIQSELWHVAARAALRSTWHHQIMRVEMLPVNVHSHAHTADDSINNSPRVRWHDRSNVETQECVRSNAMELARLFKNRECEPFLNLSKAEAHWHSTLILEDWGGLGGHTWTCSSLIRTFGCIREANRNCHVSWQ